MLLEVFLKIKGSPADVLVQLRGLFGVRVGSGRSAVSPERSRGVDFSWFIGQEDL
jgi:hypothetical protein